MDINSSTKLINTKTNEYPQYLRNLYAQNPTISFPEIMPEEMAARYGFCVVKETKKPAGDVVTEGFPQIVEGVYKQQWNVRPFNEQELADQIVELRKKKEYDFRDAIKQIMIDGLMVEGDAEVGPGVAGKPKLEHFKEVMVYGGDLNNLIMIREVAKTTTDKTFWLETIDGDKELPTPVVVEITILTMQKVYELQRWERSQVAALYKAQTINDINQVDLTLHKFKY